MTLRVITDPAAAASALTSALTSAPSARIDYQPGDGTRYDLLMFWSEGICYLALLNIGGWTVPLKGRQSVDAWVKSGMPRGSWRGLRGLLCYLGAAVGPETYDPDQAQRDEMNARAETSWEYPHTADGVRERETDLAVGRLVRNLLMEQMS